MHPNVHSSTIYNIIFSKPRSAFVGKHKLSPFEIITGQTMNLHLPAFDNQLFKRDKEIKHQHL